MATQQYIGITLGPISRIMTYTQSTKSLWGASYFMSFLAKQLISDSFKEGRVFLKPQLQETMWSIYDGVGRFPDQYIFESQKGDFEKLLLKRNEVFKLIGKDIAQTLGKNSGKEKKEIICYLKNTIKIYVIEMNEWDASKSILDQCQQALNVMECRDCYQVCESRNYLAEYFEKIHLSSLLIDDAFGITQTGYRLFQTIIECSAANAVKMGLINKQELFNDKKVESLPSVYKYIAFVSSDGDNIGKALGKLGHKLSDVLLKYNIEIVNIVNKWGGQVIYSGGDDLLFFAPISSIFTLIKEIDDTFNSTLSSSEAKEINEILGSNNMPIPTLSFGVSISYYKHPMSESLRKSEELLKQAKDSGRNCIVWNVRKHSGQSIKSTFQKKHTEIYNAAINIINNSVGQKNIVFLHSVSHYLLQHKAVLNHILSGGNSDKIKEELVNYMANTFKNADHQNHEENLQMFRNFLQDASAVEADKNEAIDKLHALLRYIELLISKQDTAI